VSSHNRSEFQLSASISGVRVAKDDILSVRVLCTMYPLPLSFVAQLPQCGPVNLLEAPVMATGYLK